VATANILRRCTAGTLWDGHVEATGFSQWRSPSSPQAVPGGRHCFQRKPSRETTVLCDQGLNVMTCPTSAMTCGWETQSWRSSWVSGARTADTPMLYTTHGSLDLTGGQAMLRDSRHLALVVAIGRSFSNFGCTWRARLECKSNVNCCRVEASLWKLLGPSDDFTTRALPRYREGPTYHP
jgi:hypothetical protein